MGVAVGAATVGIDVGFAVSHWNFHVLVEPVAATLAPALDAVADCCAGFHVNLKPLLAPEGAFVPPAAPVVGAGNVQVGCGAFASVDAVDGNVHADGALVSVEVVVGHDHEAHGDVGAGVSGVSLRAEYRGGSSENGMENLASVDRPLLLFWAHVNAGLERMSAGPSSWKNLPAGNAGRGANGFTAGCCAPPTVALATAAVPENGSPLPARCCGLQSNVLVPVALVCWFHWNVLALACPRRNPPLLPAAVAGANGLFVLGVAVDPDGAGWKRLQASLKVVLLVFTPDTEPGPNTVLGAAVGANGDAPALVKGCAAHADPHGACCCGCCGVGNVKGDDADVTLGNAVAGAANGLVLPSTRAEGKAFDPLVLQLLLTRPNGDDMANAIVGRQVTSKETYPASSDGLAGADRRADGHRRRRNRAQQMNRQRDD